MSLNTAYSSGTVHAHCLVKCTQSLCKFQRKNSWQASLLCFDLCRDRGQSSNWCTVMSFLRGRSTSAAEQEVCLPMTVYVRDKTAFGGGSSCPLTQMCRLNILLTGSMLKQMGLLGPCSLSCLAMIYGDKISFLWDDVLHVRLIQ